MGDGRSRCCGRGSRCTSESVCVDVVEHILTGDSAAGASTRKLRHIDAMVIDEAAHHRRQQHVARHTCASCRCRSWRRCRCRCGRSLWRRGWSRCRSGFRRRSRCRFRRRCRCRRGCRCRCDSTRCCADHRNHRANGDRFTGWHSNFCQRSRDGRWNFGVHFVGGHFEQRFVGGNGVAHILEPTSDGSFGDRFTKLREDDVSHE